VEDDPGIRRGDAAFAVAVEWLATAMLFVIGIANGTVNTLATLWVLLGVLFGAAFVGALTGIVFRDSETSA
jgi:hypothetical protein